jgi:hypothetical protein
MSRQTQEAERQHLLLIVDSAQRAGFSEEKIGELVAEAVESDTKHERAA